MPLSCDARPERVVVAARRASGTCRARARARAASRSARASRSSTHSSSSIALSRSTSVTYGAAKMRSRYAKPQSSWSQRLKARKAATTASGSSESASSIPTPSVGKKNAPRMRCLSITSMRASRFRYSAWIGSSSPKASRIEAPRLVLPLVVVVEAARARDGVEGRVRDEAVHRARDQQLLPTAYLRPVHAAPPHLAVEVTREGVLGLVVVVVAVEDLEGKLGHGRPLRANGGSVVRGQGPGDLRREKSTRERRAVI